MPDANMTLETSILDKAIKAVPAVKYALGIGGIIAVISIIRSGFKIDLRVAAVGTIVMLILMVVLVVVASLVGQKSSAFRIPALVFTWFCLVLFMATSCTLFGSVFLGHPHLNWAFIVSASTQQQIPNQPTKPSDNTPPVEPDGPETLAQKYERLADSNAADAIYREYCAWKPKCPDYGNPQALSSATTSDWRNAMFYWQEARDISKNPVTVALIKAKLNPGSSLSCTLDHLNGAGSCDAIPKSFDTVKIGKEEFSSLRRPMF